MERQSSWARRDVLRLGGLVGMGLGGTLLLPGCGSSGDGGNATVNIANTGSNNTLMMQKFLKQQGYLEDFDANATMKNLQDGTKVLAAMISGNADVTMTSGLGELLASVEKGAKVKILGGSCVLSQVALYSSKPEIKSMDDLTGKSIGTGSPGAQLHQIMTALFKAKGMKTSKVKFVNIGTSADVMRAVIAGKVDAGPSVVDYYETAKQDGIHVIADIWRDIPQFTYQVIYASQRAIDEKREGLVRTLAAHAKLYRFIQSPKSKSGFLKAYESVTPDQEDRAMSLWNFAQRYKPYAADLQISNKSLRYMQKLAVEDGSIKDLMPDDKIIDRSLAKDAIKLLDGER